MTTRESTLPPPFPPTIQMINTKKPLGYRLIESELHASATMDEGSVAWHYSRILAWARIGKNVSIGGGTEIGRSTVVGDGTRIGANCFIPGHTQIGERVFIGPNVVMCDDRHPRVRQEGEPPYTAEPPIIEDDVSIGAGVVILPGVRIGQGATIAAGALVTKDVEPFIHVRGQPARETALSATAVEGWKK